MKIRKILHKNVRLDGTFTDKSGAVTTTGTVRMSRGEGCSLENCSCSEGHWLSVFLPLRNGIVEGIMVQFEDGEEMETFLNTHEIEGSE